MPSWAPEPEAAVKQFIFDLVCLGAEILPKHPEVKLARVGRNFG